MMRKQLQKLGTGRGIFWGQTLLLFFTLGVIKAGAETPPPVLHLASTDWCPYTCESHPAGKGIVADYIRQLLEPYGVELTISFYPWSRAVAQATTGEVDGLLTAVPEEAPGLLFTKTATTSYQMCFYARPGEQWQFTDAASLSAIKLGVSQGYSYGEPVDHHIALAQGKGSVTAIRGENSVARLWGMLLLNRFDAFIEDQTVVALQSHEQAFDLTGLSHAGCLTERPFYLAFYPAGEHASQWQVWFDNILTQPQSQVLLDEVRRHYVGQ